MVNIAVTTAIKIIVKHLYHYMFMLRHFLATCKGRM